MPAYRPTPAPFLSARRRQRLDRARTANTPPALSVFPGLNQPTAWVHRPDTTHRALKVRCIRRPCDRPRRPNPMRVITIIDDLRVAEQILRHLGAWLDPPPLRSAYRAHLSRSAALKLCGGYGVAPQSYGPPRCWRREHPALPKAFGTGIGRGRGSFACDLLSAGLGGKRTFVSIHNADGRSHLVARPPAVTPSGSLTCARFGSFPQGRPTLPHEDSAQPPLDHEEIEARDHGKAD